MLTTQLFAQTVVLVIIQLGLATAYKDFLVGPVNIYHALVHAVIMANAIRCKTSLQKQGEFNIIKTRYIYLIIDLYNTLLYINYRNTNSQSFAYTDIWDATKIYGCACDSSYYDYQCAEALCPAGDDPLTVGQVNDVQIIKCVAISGRFLLYYK